MIIRDILKKKGNAVHTIHPTKTLSQAVGILCEKKIGAVVVVDDREKPVGILSERDILNQVNRGTDLDRTTVADVMTKDLVIGFPDDSLDHTMATMTEMKIRHLPIMEEGTLQGLVSIGDVVHALRKSTESEIHFLRDYFLN